jgi:hypothetical protein
MALGKSLSFIKLAVVQALFFLFFGPGDLEKPFSDPCFNFIDGIIFSTSEMFI